MSSSDVFFPPHSLSDLVVHYEGVSFHVHAVVMHRHSEWFATVIDMLRGEKDPECKDDHNGACVIVPRITTAEGEVMVAAMQRVLRWMYFPRWGSSMPYLSTTESELDHCHDEEAMRPWQQPWLTPCAGKKLVARSENGKKSMCSAALSLLSYWRCSPLLERCQDMFSVLIVRANTNSLCFWLACTQNGVHSEIEKKCIARLKKKGKEKYQDNKWYKDLSVRTIAKLEGKSRKRRRVVA
jgi:hypothetical protein